MSPSTHNFTRHSRQLMCSFTLEDLSGFWSTYVGANIQSMFHVSGHSTPLMKEVCCECT